MLHNVATTKLMHITDNNQNVQNKHKNNTKNGQQHSKPFKNVQNTSKTLNNAKEYSNIHFLPKKLHIWKYLALTAPKGVRRLASLILQSKVLVSDLVFILLAKISRSLSTSITLIGKSRPYRRAGW